MTVEQQTPKANQPNKVRRSANNHTFHPRCSVKKTMPSPSSSSLPFFDPSAIPDDGSNHSLDPNEDDNSLSSEDEENKAKNGQRDRSLSMDDSSSNPNHQEGSSSTNEPALAQEETILVKRSKLFMYLVLLTAAVAAAVATYFFVSQGQHDDFEREFHNAADEVLKGAEHSAKQIFGTIVKLGDSLTSSALSANEDKNGKMSSSLSWPNVTLPNFDIRTTAPFEETYNSADVVLFAPKVAQQDRQGFEQYAAQHQGWIADDLRYKGLHYARPGRIPLEIHTLSQDDALQPFAAPLWQMGPVPEALVDAIILKDLYTHPSFRRMIDDVEIDKKLLVSTMHKQTNS